VLQYYGDHVPNFTQYKRTDPAHCGPGYDYDVITAEALMERATVKDGRIVLPDGMNYRVLVLPERDQISLPVLNKVAELVKAGATVIGPQPVQGETLADAVKTDAEIRRIAGGLWGGQTGSGRVISGKTAREVLAADGVAPDCEFSSAGDFDFIHRTTGEAEIYFVASRTNIPSRATVAFRAPGRAPELWNAVTGERGFATTYEEKAGRVSVPLEFAPCGSWFVIFRAPAAEHPATGKPNFPVLAPVADLAGAWTVHFDPQWGGPETVSFASLTDWTTRPEPGIQFYSGTAVYEKTFPVEASQVNSKLWLDLGEVRELAEVKVNGKSCGVVWCPPWRVEVTGAVQAGENRLTVEVVNFWPNRIIGDARSPKAPHYTRTNIRKLTAKTPLMESGLLGPVRVVAAAE